MKIIWNRVIPSRQLEPISLDLLHMTAGFSGHVMNSWGNNWAHDPCTAWASGLSVAHAIAMLQSVDIVTRPLGNSVDEVLGPPNADNLQQRQQYPHPGHVLGSWGPSAGMPAERSWPHQ